MPLNAKQAEKMEMELEENVEISKEQENDNEITVEYILSPSPLSNAAITQDHNRRIHNPSNVVAG